MTDIKRYAIVWEQMDEISDGDYVLYTDHIAALEAVKATVKPLEWHTYPEDGSRMFEGQNQRRNFVSRALLPWSGALFVMEKDGIFSLTLSMEDVEGVFASEDEAKAAAQAYYEQRVLSALVPSPALEANEQTEPMKLEISREWFEKRAAAEGDLEIGAGSRKTMTLNLTDAELAELEKLANPEAARLRAALNDAADQLSRVHDDAFKQAAGYGLRTSDGRDFSCYELNRCQTAAGKARAALSDNPKGDGNGR